MTLSELLSCGIKVNGQPLTNSSMIKVPQMYCITNKLPAESVTKNLDCNRELGHKIKYHELVMMKKEGVRVKDGEPKKATVELSASHPYGSIYWVIENADALAYNDRSNYTTYSGVEDNGVGYSPCGTISHEYKINSATISKFENAPPDRFIDRDSPLKFIHVYVKSTVDNFVDADVAHLTSLLNPTMIISVRQTTAETEIIDEDFSEEIKTAIDAEPLAAAAEDGDNEVHVNHKVKNEIKYNYNVYVCLNTIRILSIVWTEGVGWTYRPMMGEKSDNVIDTKSLATATN
jgi:hypothetical protein